MKRRKFIDSTMKVIAAAAGISVIELENLLAAEGLQDRSKRTDERQQEYSIYQKSVLAEIKALKVLVENDKRVFENEYGRVTPVENIPFDRLPQFKFPELPGDSFRGCFVNWGAYDDFDGCITNFWTDGGFCGGLRTCKAGNTCDGQTCGNLYTCAPNNCPGQDCPILSACPGGNNQNFPGSFIEQYITDSYIQHLMNQFNVKSSVELANKLDALLSNRRKFINRQLSKPKKIIR